MSRRKLHWNEYRKALAALVLAVATWAGSYYPDDADVQKWLGLALALVTAGSVYGVANRPAPGRRADPSVSEQGHGDVNSLIYIVVFIIVLLVLLRIAHIY